MGAILSRADLRRTATNMLIVGGLSIFIKHAHNVQCDDVRQAGWGSKYALCMSEICACPRYAHYARYVHVHDSSRVKC